MLKSELINQAYAQIRISGLTTQAVPEEINYALAELDQIMDQWVSIGRDVNYNFPTRTDVNHPVVSDPDDESGIYPWAISGVIAYLAKSLVEYFGKEVPASLAAKSRYGLNIIKGKTVQLRSQQYPNRMPIGSGNHFREQGYISRFYRPAYPGRDQPTDIILDEIIDLVSDFTRDLDDDQTLDSYTIAVEGDITLVSDSLTNNEVAYRIQATGDSDGKVTIIGTTSDGRTLPRAYCFTTQDNTCVVTQA